MNIPEPDGYLSTIGGALEKSEMERWREVQSTLDALVDNPEAFSRGESIDAHRKKYVELGLIYASHDFPTGADMVINTATGAIYLQPLIEADVALEEA